MLELAGEGLEYADDATHGRRTCRCIDRQTHRPPARCTIPSRVIAKPYLPGEEIAPGTGTARRPADGAHPRHPGGRGRARCSPRRSRCFAARHQRFEELLERHFELVAHHVPRRRRCRASAGCSSAPTSPTSTRSRGPRCSIRRSCRRPIRPGLRPGEQRFVMSLRAVGEGHISSIEFRTGVIDGASDVTFDPLGPRAGHGRAARRRPATTRPRSAPSWSSSAPATTLAWSVLDRLPERFTLAELEQSLGALERDGPPHAISFETVKIIRVLGVVELRHDVPRRLGAVGAGDLSRRARTRRTAWRTPASSASPTTTAASRTTRPTPPSTASRSCRS